MKIGNKVHCTAYAERIKGGISVMDCAPFFDQFHGLDDDIPCKEIVYFDTEKNEINSIPWSEFTDVTVDKFKVIKKEFDGVYVGTTYLTTRLSATYNEDEYGNDCIRFAGECVKPFAVVYYANNRKRFVPIDCVKGGEADA